MSSFYSAKQKIDLAMSIVAEFKGISNTDSTHLHLILQKLNQLEYKYLNSNNSYCDISDFCISLAEMPLEHFEFMLLIGWLDNSTHRPMPGRSGFYEDVYYTRQGITESEHFITVNAYVQLLLIELQISDMYSKHNSG